MGKEVEMISGPAGPAHWTAKMELAERHRRCHSLLPLYLNAGVIDGLRWIRGAEKWELGILCPVCPYITEQSLKMGSTPAHHFRWVFWFIASPCGQSHGHVAATQIMDNTMSLYFLVLPSPSLLYSPSPWVTLPAHSTDRNPRRRPPTHDLKHLAALKHNYNSHSLL
ncbi:hypothetical protein SUGI_0995900 [Cryptomeria japonica]|nr:hypothetical protein SUGI_0995900 [Cryptomeria japonica]